jgi:HK97 family phage prohead protease
MEGNVCKCHPKPGEDRKSFIGRCMGVMESKGTPRAQAAAICFSIWRKESDVPDDKVMFRAVLSKADEKGIYSAIASTSEEDRDGEIVQPSAFKNLERFVSDQGPIYYSHAWRTGGITEETMPIGKAVGAWQEPDKVGVKYIFAEGGPMTFASKVKWMVDNGFLRFMSIGAMPTKWETDTEGRKVFTELELLEVSVVGIPSNRGAAILSSAKAAGIEISEDEAVRLFGAESLSKSAPNGVKQTEDETVTLQRMRAKVGA